MTERAQTNELWTLRPLTRRTILAGGLGAIATAALGQDLFGASPASASTGAILPLVHALPNGTPVRADFAANEQVLARYLMIVAPMANDIVDDDPTRFGYMDGGWWRTPSAPYNARVQEHVATLTWFYANDRVWNPYFGDGALLARIDAAIGHYLSLQHDDGSFTEYSETEHSRAATGFGMVALSEVLENLRSTNALSARQTQLETSIRRAAEWFVDLNNGYWTTPLFAVNQTVAGLAGVARAAEVLGDGQISYVLNSRIDFLAAHGQAPAGFFHEDDGFDFGYNFYVMLPDLADLYMKTANPLLVEMAAKWTDFFRYASVRELGSPGYVMYSAISSRGAATTLETFASDDADRGALATAFVAEVPALAAFRATRQEKSASRASWTASATPLVARAKQDTSPRLWMHVTEMPEDPTAAQKVVAENQLPYRISDRFTEHRTGTEIQEYLFVRRPGYYFGAFYGTRSSTINRTGPGLLWHPQAGTIVLSLNVAGAASWGVLDHDGIDSALGNATVGYHAGASVTSPPMASSDLHNVLSTFTTTSVSSSNGAVSYTVFWDDGVTIETNVTTSGTATIPLVLRPTDQIKFSDGTVVPVGASTSATATGFSILRDGVTIQFGWGAAAAATLTPTNSYVFPDRKRRLHTLTVPVAGENRMDITFAAAPVLTPMEVAVTSSASSTQVDGRRYLAVRSTNFENGPVDIRFITPFGEYKHSGVRAGQSVTTVFDGSSEIADWAQATVAAYKWRDGQGYYSRTTTQVTDK